MHILSHSWASQLREALIITMLNYYHDNTDRLACFFFSSFFWNDRDKWLFSVTKIFNQSKCRPFDYFWSHSYPSKLGKHHSSTFTDGEGKTFSILSEHLKVARYSQYYLIHASLWSTSHLFYSNLDNFPNSTEPPTHRSYYHFIITNALI